MESCANKSNYASTARESADPCNTPIFELQRKSHDAVLAMDCQLPLL